MKISVIIPTRNRQHCIKRVLDGLQKQTYSPSEIIIVDASDDRSYLKEIEVEFNDIPLVWITSLPSVCIQRNLGIKKALHEWIFLCDDDLELPSDYLEKIFSYVKIHPEAGAVSGNVLQLHKGNWSSQYPVKSALVLTSHYLFNTGMWGSIEVKSDIFLIRYIRNYFKKRGNYLSKAGWPVLTEFSGTVYKTRFYGLGASIIKKEWLNNSLYDEVLDPHGIGDNYGVALGFPKEGVHILNDASVYHHESSENRLPQSVLYYRRMLALHYFITTRKELKHIKIFWFMWSLVGMTLSSIYVKDLQLLKANLKLLAQILLNRNPYVNGKRMNLKTVIPQL